MNPSLWLSDNWVEYEAVIGSRAYGLARKDSDWDLRGWYLPPVHYTLGLTEVPEQVADHRDSLAPEASEPVEVVWYELKKFIRLALQGNPNILEILWSPQVRRASPLARDLLYIRPIFLSQRLKNTHLGYATEQLTKMRNHADRPWKHAMHLLRVLLAGISAFETGEILVEIIDPAWRETLRQVRAGAVSQEDFDTLHQDLRARFDRAVALKLLPPEPDVLRADQFLIGARTYAWESNRN
jgi:hypothetical protein